MADSALQRWRLVLGKFAQNGLGTALEKNALARDAALEFLYGREYRGRNVYQEGGPGSLEASQLSVPDWLDEVRRVFPQSTTEQITRHALERYEMTELVNDPKVLAALKPDFELLRLMMGLKGQCQPSILPELRRLIGTVVEELTRELAKYVTQTFAGRVNRQRRGTLKVAGNFDAKSTIRVNLKYYDPSSRRLVPRDVRFFSRLRREVPWDVVICVDQSGSMAASLIYSAVMASIFAGLPRVNARLVVFDTAVVDLSDQIRDPVSILMGVQLGGGTDIGGALGYCQTLVRDPHRSVLVLVSDFCEGASPRELYARCRQIAESGVKLLGLAALDPEGKAFYDHQIAGKLATCGMEIAALTPKELTQWLKSTIS